MKQLISGILAILLLLCSSLFLSACARGAPELDEVYDRVVELVEASHEINTVFYGVGMPVYRADSEYASINHIYHDFSQSKSYEFVTEHAKYPSEEAVMAAASRVYGEDILNNVLSVSAFTGYAIEDGIGGSAIARARYILQNNYFCQSTEEENVRYTAMRIYDYSTMTVHSIGRGNACTVKMESHLESTPETVEIIELHLVFERGNWYLDSFTGA